MRSELHLETSQENTLSYSGVYDRLVEDENDILGQIAYAIYKSQKDGVPVKLPLKHFKSTDMAGEFDV